MLTSVLIVDASDKKEVDWDDRSSVSVKGLTFYFNTYFASDFKLKNPKRIMKDVKLSDLDKTVEVLERDYEEFMDVYADLSGIIKAFPDEVYNHSRTDVNRIEDDTVFFKVVGLKLFLMNIWFLENMIYRGGDLPYFASLDMLKVVRQIAGNYDWKKREK